VHVLARFISWSFLGDAGQESDTSGDARSISVLSGDQFLKNPARVAGPGFVAMQWSGRERFSGEWNA
jgi:hypothetical protein